MDGTPEAEVNTARDATLLDAGARTAVFAALPPALDAFAAEAGTDARLSPDARRILRAVTRTRPADTLALADLAARASTPQNPDPARPAPTGDLRLPGTPDQHRSSPEGSTATTHLTDAAHSLEPSRPTRATPNARR